MSKPITKVELAGFRGATEPFELDFDPQKDLIMLFGENGSGKSSILDAIDIVCNDGIGSLEHVSVGHSPGQYLCTLGRPRTTLRATIHSGQESWTGTMQRNSVSTTGPDVKPRVKILRRNKVLALVTAQPRERYNALQHFIDIGVIEQSENNLQQKLQDVSRGIDDFIRIKERQLSQLENVWEAEHRPGPGQTAMAWAENTINTGITDLNTQLERLKQVVEAIEAAVTAKNDYDSKTSTATTRQRELSEIEQQIQDTPGLNAATAVRLIESLSKAKEYIDVESSLDKCPTCQRPIARDELISIVDEQLSQMTELKALSDRKNEAQRQLRTATDNLSHAEPVFLEAIQQLQRVVAAGDIPDIVDLNIVWPNWSIEQQDFDTLRVIGEAFESIQPTLEQKRDDAQRNVDQFNLIKEWYHGIGQADTEAANLDRIHQGLQWAFRIVHDKRMAFTQGILNDIATEANRLFQQIHPDERITFDALLMDEAHRGSVRQRGAFHGHSDIPPQAVFSDSHLDTLGFCVWLALAKRESPENTVILIDDIFSSVDASHLGRVIDLLSVEGQSFLQVIVATHYRLWWDRCQNARGVHRIHLGRWTLDNGICAQNMPLITEQLQNLVGSPVLDRQAVSSKAGILLENILDGLALLYGRSLPRNKQNLNTLGDLIGACKRLFSTHNLTVNKNVNWDAEGQPEDWQPTDGRQAFEKTDQLQFIRNQVGCHFNPPGTEIPDDEVREFGQATVELVEALTCSNCGYLATKPITDGTALRCSCSKQAIRMTPVAIR